MKIWPSHSKPMAVAKQLKKEVFTEPGTNYRILVWWRDSWWQFTGTHWKESETLDVLQPIWECLEEAEVETDKGVRPWEPTTAKIGGLIQPLQIVTRLPTELNDPVWLDNSAKKRPPAADLIPLANGTVNMRTGDFEEGHTPALFTTWSLPFDFEPGAECPTWMEFLEDVYGHDPKAILALQEFAGVLISGLLTLQKMLLLLGPPRSGKGVTVFVLEQLVGESRSVSPKLAQLGSEFGMSALIGKRLATFADTRLDYGTKTSSLVENLLSLTGGDKVNVNRKNKEYWSGHLSTNFILVSNEAPRLIDPSGAILTRFVAIETKKSHTANPDTTLKDRLSRELPGIFLWALRGLERVNKTGKFTVPDTQKEVLDTVGDLASPVSMFLTDNDVYEITGNLSDSVRLSEVHATFKAWCDATGNFSLPQAKFSSEVRSANLGAVPKQPYLENGKRDKRIILGMRKVNDPHAWVAKGGKE